MNDSELRTTVLRKYYMQRSEGEISVNEKTFGTEISHSEVLRISEQLAEQDLIEFKPLHGDDTIVAGVGKITERGIDVVESAEPEEIRNQILKAMYEHEDTGNPHFLSSKEIAGQLGIEDKKVRHHFEVLEREDCITLLKTSSNWEARLSSPGKQRVVEGYRPRQFTSQINIGNVISQMLGGNVQGVGSAVGSEIKQIVNDPEAFQTEVDELTNKIVEVVKNELSAEHLVSYLQAVQDLRNEMVEDEPQPSQIRQILSTLAFLGDVEGTTGLMVRIWPYLYTLLSLVSAKLP